MVYKIKAKKNNTKKRNKKSIRRKLRRNKTKKNKKSTRRRKRGAGFWDRNDYNKPTIRDRFSGHLTNITPRSSDKYEHRLNKQTDNVIYDKNVHMQSLYGNTEIKPQCDKNTQICKCTSDNKRIKDLINMLENGGICTDCEKQCPKMQKILEKYKGLSNIDLRSLPFTYFGYSRSRFPAYYKGYMTPKRIKTYINYLLRNEQATIIDDNNLKTMLTGYEPIYDYDKDGNMISRCSLYIGGDAPEAIKNCNKIFKYINDLNKELHKNPTNKKKYILLEDKYIVFQDKYIDEDEYNNLGVDDNTDKIRNKLILIDKDVFTTKYRPEILEIENEIEIKNELDI